MWSPLQDPVDATSIRRALVIKLRHHGDVLLASPVFTTLRRAAPQAELDALVYLETAPMLANHPAIARLFTIDRGVKRQGVVAQVQAERRLIAALRARRYDLIVHLTEHPRGATLTRVLRPRYAVARERPDAGRWWSNTFTHLYQLPRITPRHTVETNLDALRRIGIYPTPAEKALVLVPGEATERVAVEALAKHGVAPGEFIQCHPGSRWMFKCWPPERTAALLDRIAASGHRVVLTGAPDAAERALNAATLALVQPATRAAIADLSGALPLEALAAITVRARAFVGVDTAPMHIAAAVGTPTLAIFGPSGHELWGPWMVPHRVVVSSDFPCLPCGRDGCGGGRLSECLTTLPVERVARAFFDLVADTRQAGASGPGARSH
jgi:heptosyltransferase-3